MLRLYAAGDLPGALVTPLRTRGRKPAPAPSVTTQFLDPAGKVKVPTRESFVGRRRQLQNCLRVLTQSPDEVGVLIHGMGGLGKSSLAARLCDRLPTFERVVWVGRIDEGNLVSRLAEKLDDNEQRKSLQNYDEELRFRLRRVLQQLHEGGKSFLLVLDDFEVNLAPRNESYVLQAEAAEVLKALVWAIRENYTSHRIIITCRYDFEFSQLQYFYKQPLDALQGADLRKKFNRLTAFGEKSQVDEALKLQAQKLADGNPRLLEWLDKILQNKTVDRAAILQRLAADPVELREQVLAEALLQQMDETMREMLSRCLVFELPVPREALAAVCENIPNLEDYINRAVALGLLEVSHDEALRVPRILRLQLTLIKETDSLYKNAANVLYRLWWQKAEVLTEEQKMEIYRLALLGKQENIFVKIGCLLAKFWNSKYKYKETVLLCKDILKLVSNHEMIYYQAKAEEGLGHTSEAVDCYIKALQLCPPEDEKTISQIFQGYISLYCRKGPLEKDVLNEYIRVYFGAFQLQQKNSGIRTQLAEVYSLTMTFELCAGLALRQNQIELAKFLYECCLDFYDKVCDIPTKIKMGEYSSINSLCGSKARILCHLGTINLDQGNTNGGRKLYLQAAQLFGYAGDDHNRAVTLAAIGTGWLRQGDTGTALNYLHEASAIMKRLAIPELERVNKLIAEAQTEKEKDN